MSPSSALERFLSQMKYPATRDDLLREATREGLADDDLASLRALDSGSYAARREVICALRIADELVAA